MVETQSGKLKKYMPSSTIYSNILDNKFCFRSPTIIIKCRKAKEKVRVLTIMVCLLHFKSTSRNTRAI